MMEPSNDSPNHQAAANHVPDPQGEEDPEGGFTSWSNETNASQQQARRQQVASNSSTESQQARTAVAALGSRNRGGGDGRREAEGRGEGGAGGGGGAQQSEDEESEFQTSLKISSHVLSCVQLQVMLAFPSFMAFCDHEVQ